MWCQLEHWNCISICGKFTIEITPFTLAIAQGKALISEEAISAELPNFNLQHDKDIIKLETANILLVQEHILGRIPFSSNNV